MYAAPISVCFRKRFKLQGSANWLLETRSNTSVITRCPQTGPTGRNESRGYALAQIFNCDRGKKEKDARATSIETIRLVLQSTYVSTHLRNRNTLCKRYRFTNYQPRHSSLYEYESNNTIYTFPRTNNLLCTSLFFSVD